MSGSCWPESWPADCFFISAVRRGRAPWLLRTSAELGSVWCCFVPSLVLFCDRCSPTRTRWAAPGSLVPTLAAAESLCRSGLAEVTAPRPRGNTPNVTGGVFLSPPRIPAQGGVARLAAIADPLCRSWVQTPPPISSGDVAVSWKRGGRRLRRLIAAVPRVEWFDRTAVADTAGNPTPPPRLRWFLRAARPCPHWCVGPADRRTPRPHDRTGQVRGDRRVPHPQFSGITCSTRPPSFGLPAENLCACSSPPPAPSAPLPRRAAAQASPSATATHPSSATTTTPPTPANSRGSGGAPAPALLTRFKKRHRTVGCQQCRGCSVRTFSVVSGANRRPLCPSCPDRPDILPLSRARCRAKFCSPPGPRCHMALGWGVAGHRKGPGANQGPGWSAPNSRGSGWPGHPSAAGPWAQQK